MSIIHDAHKPLNHFWTKQCSLLTGLVLYNVQDWECSSLKGQFTQKLKMSLFTHAHVINPRDLLSAASTKDIEMFLLSLSYIEMTACGVQNSTGPHWLLL